MNGPKEFETGSLFVDLKSNSALKYEWRNIPLYSSSLAFGILCLKSFKDLQFIISNLVQVARLYVAV